MSKPNVVLKKVTSLHYAVMPVENADLPVNNETAVGMVVDGSIVEPTSPIASHATPEEFAKMVKVRVNAFPARGKTPAIAVPALVTDTLEEMIACLNKTLSVVDVIDATGDIL